MNLRYGMNPHQGPSTATPIDPASPPFRFLHGDASYINVLDAAAAWQLVRRHPAIAALTVNTNGKIQNRVNDQLLRTAAYGNPLDAADRAQWLRQLDQVAFVSDGALPFADNVEQAARHGVRYIAEPGDSIRSADVLAECQQRGVTLLRTGVRLFRH